MLCSWADDDSGLGPVFWTNLPDEGDSFSATVGLVDRRNILRFNESAVVDHRFADAAADAASKCLRESSLSLSDVDAIAAAPARRGFRAALATCLAVPVQRIIVAELENVHTAALAAALAGSADRIPAGARVLLVAAGAGITAGAAIYSTSTRGLSAAHP